jgi:mannose-6-phosphate isomerase-like protein (cupin superfamily)
VGNVEFLARTVDTPRFTLGIIEIAPGRELEAHVHPDEDDAFYIVEGEMTFLFSDQRVTAPPGTFVLVPPGVEHTASVTMRLVQYGCSTFTHRRDSTAASVSTTDLPRPRRATPHLRASRAESCACPVRGRP